MQRDRLNGGICHSWRAGCIVDSGIQAGGSPLQGPRIPRCQNSFFLPPLPVNETGFPKTYAVPRQGLTLLIKRYSPGSQR